MVILNLKNIISGIMICQMDLITEWRWQKEESMNMKR
jgi:hypothetical protein